jgi:hypothetical protein
MHASQPDDACFEDAVEFLDCLKNHTTNICVDPGHDFDIATNSSIIWFEYITKIRGGTLGYAILHYLAKTYRVLEKPKNAIRAKKKRILQCVKNKRDRIYVNVACSCADELFITEDNEDFGVAAKKRLRKEIGITIQNCCEARL